MKMCLTGVIANYFAFRSRSLLIAIALGAGLPPLASATVPRAR